MTKNTKWRIVIFAVCMLAAGIGCAWVGFTVAACVFYSLWFLSIGVFFYQSASVDYRHLEQKESELQKTPFLSPVEKPGIDNHPVELPVTDEKVSQEQQTLKDLEKLSAIFQDVQATVADTPRLPETASWIPTQWGMTQGRIKAFIPKGHAPFSLLDTDKPVNPAYCVTYFYHKSLQEYIRCLDDIPGPEARSVKEFLIAGFYTYVSDTLGLQANTPRFYSSEIPLAWCIWALTEATSRVISREVSFLAAGTTFSDQGTRGVLLTKIETEYRLIVNDKIRHRVETTQRMDQQNKKAQQNQRYRAKRMAKRHRRRN